MNAAIEPQSDKPPYVPWKTFLNFIASLRESGLPNRIDRSVLAAYSGATQSFLLGALRFLKLITEAGVPSTTLAELVSHPVNEKVLLEKIIRTSYPFVFAEGFNLQAATESQLNERFQEKGLSGETVRKAVSFFVIACEYAGIPLGSHIRAKRSGNGSGQTRRPYRRRRQIQGDEQTEPPEVPNPNQSLQDKLIAKFPEFDPGWSEDMQKKWFDAFEKFMTTAKKSDSQQSHQ